MEYEVSYLHVLLGDGHSLVVYLTAQVKNVLVLLSYLGFFFGA